MPIPVTKILARGTAVLAAALALTACGSASHTSSTPAAASASTTSVTSSTTSSGSSSTSSSQSTASAGTPVCRAADLALSFLGGQGATGHGELGFALLNTGSTSCRTYGYPGVQFLARSGATLPTTPTHTTTDFFGSSPLKALVIAPGQSFSFRLGTSHGSASSAGCTTAYGLQVIAPDDTATLRTSITDGAYECGSVTVSPVQPGPTAYH